MAKHNPAGILLIATNPVDVLTYAAWKLSGFAAGRVIGSGTVLDTSRFRYLLSRHFGVDARSIHAYIIGEHGDSEVPVWSLANIAGMRLPEFCQAQNLPYDPHAMDEIFVQTRDAAYRIIERKGATYYAVAAGLMRITQAILRNQSTVLSTSSLIKRLLRYRRRVFQPAHGDRSRRGGKRASSPTELGRDRKVAALRRGVEDHNQEPGAWVTVPSPE